MVHALITAVICLPIMVFGFCPIMYFLPAMFYVGREFAQAEYRYIEEYCDRKRANMPWWAPFTPKAWTLKGMLDWVLPILVSLGMVVLHHFLI